MQRTGYAPSLRRLLLSEVPTIRARKSLRHMIARWDAVNVPASEVAGRLRSVIDSATHDLDQAHRIVRATRRALATPQPRLPLNQWDPLGVSSPRNTDEYDCLIGPLLTLLVRGEGYPDIIILLRSK